MIPLLNISIYLTHFLKYNLDYISPIKDVNL